METLNELTIKEANKRIEKIDNKLEYYLNKKEQAFNKTQPKAATLTDSVKSTNISDKNMEYMMLCEELDPIINDLQDDKVELLNFIDRELKILNKYNELEQLIIYYKEQYTPKPNEKITWYFISRKVHASESTCRRIYRRYKKQRNI